MQNEKLVASRKSLVVSLIAIVIGTFINYNALAETAETPASSAVPVADYDPTGSIFQRIADFEQERILLQLAKEKAQLQLDTDRLAAEQLRIQNEVAAMSGAGDNQSDALDLERQKLELERQKLEQQRADMANPAPAAKQAVAPAEAPSALADRYRLSNIVGAGSQLIATVEDQSNGQRKKLTVGSALDDWTVQSISLDNGIVLAKDDETTTLGIINTKN